MDRYEAESKLKLYHDTYGDLVYTAEPQAMREHALDFRAQAKEIQGETEQSLGLLVKAVQYESIAQCRDDLGPNWVSPVAAKQDVEETDNVRSLSKVRQLRIEKEGAVITNEDRKEILARAEAIITEIDDNMEPEIFSMKQLTQDVIKPRFKIGDPCWVADWDEVTGEVIGYVPATVVGLEWMPDEVHYMIGFHDDYDNTVSTNFETVQDDEIFAELPDDSKPKPKGKPVLRIVK